MGLFDEALNLFRMTAKMRHLRFKLNSLVMIFLLHCRAFLPENVAQKIIVLLLKPFYLIISFVL